MQEANELILSAAAARAADARAIEEWGIPSFALMESAGRASADEIGRALASAPPQSGTTGEILVLCGPGNNGGDGLVVARTLRNRGHRARVVAVGGAAQLESGSADVAQNLTLWRGLNGEVHEVVDADDVQLLAREMRSVTLVVDALFGTGLARPLEGTYAEVVRATNACPRPVHAVDVPSGLDADTGAVHGVAVRADVTVTFVARKAGFSRGEGPGHVGRVVTAEIGIPVHFAEYAAELHPPRA